jgi:hypothetical protein
VAVREELQHEILVKLPFVPRPGAFDPEHDLRCALKSLHVPADVTTRERGQGETTAQERQSRDPAAGAAGSPIDPETFRSRSGTSSISIHPVLIGCAFQVWWQQLRAKHPIPSRTRPLSATAPMVLRLKTWESRSLPDLKSASSPSSLHPQPMPAGPDRPRRQRRGKAWTRSLSDIRRRPPHITPEGPGARHHRLTRGGAAR